MKNKKKKSLSIGEIAINWTDDQLDQVRSETTGKKYLIDGEPIQDAELICNDTLVVFRTKKGLAFRDLDNEPISHSDSWSDYYFDSISDSFYRQDKRGFWYDVEGARLTSSVILKTDVLISLDCKVSKQNQIFEGNIPYISPNGEMIQVGKVVFDKNLNPIKYYNERITGLGKNSISFKNGVVYQEVKLGISNGTFLNEEAKEPIKVLGREVTSYEDRLVLGDFSYHVFSNSEQKFYLDEDNGTPLDIEGLSFSIQPRTYLRIGDIEVVRVKSDKEVFYYNLTENEILRLSEFGHVNITKAAKSNIAINKCELINISSKKRSMVIRSDDQCRYQPSNSLENIEGIKNVPGFEGLLAMVSIEGKEQLFSLISEEVVRLENVTVRAVDGHPKNKLLNAVDSNGERLTIDLRKGFRDLTMAFGDGTQITQTIGAPHTIGTKVLQNVKVKTLGGAKSRVIDLNSENLEIFSLPKKLVSFTDGEVKSIFAGIQLESIDFKKIIKVGGSQYYKAKFRSYDEELQTVVLDLETGNPLQMDGLGHKLELVTDFNDYTTKKSYFLGAHQMISAQTLKEDLKKDELLYSSDSKSSWLPFSDMYLPIFTRVVETNGSGDWDYHLFELRTLSNDKEFIAIEKNPPHRILVKKKGGKYFPIVVKSKEKILKSPEEISVVRKLFFEDPGVLMDVF